MNTRSLQGLLWREWLLHREELTWIFSVWLLGVWVVPMHPQWFMFPFGVLSACLVAPSFGGSDASEGSEEFSFALPPSRAERYLVRLGLGGGTLLALLGGAWLAAVLGLPQGLWSLLFESTQTVPFSAPSAPFLYGLACALSTAVFADAFAAGACCRTVGGLGYLWLRALLLGGIVMGWGFLMEGMIWHGRPNGALSCPLLGAWTVFRLVRGFRDYGNKEGVSGLPPLRQQGKSSWGILLGIFLVLIVLAALALALMFVPAGPPAIRSTSW